MYDLNKGDHGQRQPVTQIPPTSYRNHMVQKLKEGKFIVQGMDPGIVTTAVVNSRTSKLLFESLNRFTALQNNEESVTVSTPTTDDKRIAYSLRDVKSLEELEWQSIIMSFSLHSKTHVIIKYLDILMHYFIFTISCQSGSIFLMIAPIFHT